MTVAPGQDPVTQTCWIRGDLIFIRINNPLVDHTNRAVLAQSGITFSNAHFYPNGTVEQSVIVNVTMENNGTVMQCIAASSSAGIPPPIFSDEATILIAGKVVYLIVMFQVANLPML